LKEIFVPVSPGELIDKITILRLKSERMSDPVKLANVVRELELLNTVAQRSIPESGQLTKLTEELLETNSNLWDIEDDIRRLESKRQFGDGFIALARSVYFTNDRRAEIKKEINLLLGSRIVEEKSYVSVDRPLE
jgi:hypothetical protein